jgi:electron transport complex protein RnfG
MGNILKLSGILFFVAGIAAGSLAFYNSFTKPEIEELNAKLEAEAKQYVLKGLFAEDALENLIYEESEIEIGGKTEKFWKVKEKKSDPSAKAYIFLSKNRGFSGIIETMVGTDKNFVINGIKVIKHTETPGLGAEAQTIKYGENEPFFERWFKGKNSLKVVVEKDDSASPDKIQSLTGATITTRAVCEGIKSYAEAVSRIKGSGTPQTITVDPSKVIEVDIEKLRREQAEKEAAEGQEAEEVE